MRRDSRENARCGGGRVASKSERLPGGAENHYQRSARCRLRLSSASCCALQRGNRGAAGRQRERLWADIRNWVQGWPANCGGAGFREAHELANRTIAKAVEECEAGDKDGRRSPEKRTQRERSVVRIFTKRDCLDLLAQKYVLARGSARAVCAASPLDCRDAR